MSKSLPRVTVAVVFAVVVLPIAPARPVPVVAKEATPAQSVSVALDTAADGQILIEGGAPSINHTDVDVDVPALSGGNQTQAVRLSNGEALGDDGLLSDGTTFQYAAAVPWQLETGADGTRTVWAQLQTSGGWSDPVSASTYLDTTPPTGSFVINNDDAVVGDPWHGTLWEQTLTGTVTDAPGSPGTIVQMAFSNDGQHWRYEPFESGSGAFSTDWQIGDSRYGGRAPDGGFYPGLKTVYGKWQDAAGNWSAVATDTIEYVDQSSIANLYIDGKIEGDVYSPTFKPSPDVTVSVTVHIMPPVGSPLVRLRFYGNDEDTPCRVVPWPDGATTVAITWSLVDADCGYTTKDGVKDVSADIVTTKGYITVGGIVILDRVVPTADSPLPAFTLDHTVNEVASDGATTLGNSTPTTSATTTIAWKAADNNPIADYNLQRKVQATWTGITLADPSTSSTDQAVTTGSSNQYRVDATDAAGNTGAWKKGPTFSMSMIDETSRSISYSGSWRTVTQSDALGGTLKTASQKGAFAKFTFTGRAIAWVAPRSAPSGDTIAVYVDGKLIKTVALSANTYEPRRVVFSMAWKADGKHTIKLVKKYVNSSVLPVDAFLVLS